MLYLMVIEPSPRTRLLFVYNADSGIVAALLDSVHKLVSPGTYGCCLCALTYGPVTMRRVWRDWLRSAPFDARFMHRDEFVRDYPDAGVSLPAVLIERGGGPDLLIGPEELDTISSIDELTARIENALR